MSSDGVDQDGKHEQPIEAPETVAPSRGGRYHKIWIRSDTKYFRASIADTDTDTFF